MMRLIFGRRPDGIYTAHEANTPDDMAIHVESTTPDGLVEELLQVMPPREARAMIEAGLSLGLFLAKREDLNWTIPFTERPHLVRPKVPDPAPPTDALKRMIPLGVDWTEALHVSITEAVIEWCDFGKAGDPSAIVLADVEPDDRAAVTCLRDLVRVLLHEHPWACQTVWSAHGATYCWVCERSVTDHPVPGYVLVEGSGSDSAPILQGRRGNVPTIAFFTSLAEAETTRCRIGLDRCEVRRAVADRDGVRRA